MPDTVELCLKKVLKGLPLETEEAEICDYTLEEQCEALESQGIQPNFKYTADYKPTLEVTVNYIVCCVVINDLDEVLMMQEAKKTCAGKWYLPAGRMEKGEDIVTACKREVLEETGLKLECTTLLCVEASGGNWMRFVLTGRITGGRLKTPSEADQESLQAKWIRNLDELELRSNDVRSLIDRVRAYREARINRDTTWYVDQLPALRPYTRELLRLVIVIKKKETNRVHILLSEKTSWHLPTCELHPVKSIHSTLRRFMVYLFGADVPEHRPHGLLSVEFDPSTEKEGVCLTLLVAFRCPLEEVPIIGKCVWHETPKDLGDALLRRLSSRNTTIPLRAT